MLQFHHYNKGYDSVSSVEWRMRFHYSAGVMHGFGSWFEVEFSSIPDGHDYSPVKLSTSPWKPYVQITNFV